VVATLDWQEVRIGKQGDGLGDSFRDEDVLNVTVLALRERHHRRMSHKKIKKQSYQAVLVSVKKEMAQPRVAESVQIEAEKQRTKIVKRGV
jgi:hypothetical protein